MAKAFTAALFLLPTLLLTACAPGRVPPPKTVDHYFQTGDELMERELYEEAIASWQTVRENFYSPEMNMRAELKIAEAHFLAENYAEAALAYETFLEEHPDHPQAAAILFQLGLSYHRQMLSADRDQSATRNAIATFEQLVRRFPDSPQAEEARTLSAEGRDRLAAHETYVGNFYLRTEHFAAAVNRLEEIPERFPRYDELDRVYFLLGTAQLRSGNREQAALAYNTLYERFPESEYILKAQKILAEEY